MVDATSFVKRRRCVDQSSVIIDHQDTSSDDDVNVAPAAVNMASDSDEENAKMGNDMTEEVPFYDKDGDMEDHKWVQRHRADIRGFRNAVEIFTEGSMPEETITRNINGNIQVENEKKRESSKSDAVLDCPCCFTPLCFDCQRHETIVTQYRAMFVQNLIVHEEESVNHPLVSSGGLFRVTCSVCDTEVAAVDDQQVFHFFHVIPG